MFALSRSISACGNVGLRTTSASSVIIAGSVSASPRIVNDEVSCPANADSDRAHREDLAANLAAVARRRAFLHGVGDKLRETGLLGRIDREARLNRSAPPRPSARSA